jgi:hypothetical protein
MASNKGRDEWSEPISDDEVADQADTAIEDDEPADEATGPQSGSPQHAPEIAGTGAPDAPPGGGQNQSDSDPDTPPADDERAHPADFAPDGYDDRQEDAEPGARRETPDQASRDR